MSHNYDVSLTILLLLLTTTQLMTLITRVRLKVIVVKSLRSAAFRFVAETFFVLLFLDGGLRTTGIFSTGFYFSSALSAILLGLLFLKAKIS